eukprot:TRINITY_DN3990_c0_g1_i2.p1 TRINITY_DN3990_c0_g1~~TRINITY_DN3990_c0_g1_i2.p1  ORF type:complete len:700 (+),score=124.59 TRINITY_DN3990_c0_g1_i2:312-2102(+)
MKNITSKDLTAAVTILQMFLSSPKATLRFAAIRTLNKVASDHPHAIAGSCTFDMEGLINDVNRNIATLAITTLLKIETEGSIDRLMKQISNFINEISDEFKIVVVDAIRTLALKYKQRHYSIMTFLSNMLRDEGGFEYKKAIVETILEIVNEIPESKETGLAHLSEFIEDCEFSYLSTKILHLLGKEGPKTRTPSKYIRHIYNRIILENSTVRASAVSALAKFGLNHEPLRPKIIVLLTRCLQDNDDEVRDRATFYLRMLENDLELASKMMIEDLPIPLYNLELSLRQYLDNPIERPFDINTVPAFALVDKTLGKGKKSTTANQPAKPKEEPVEKISSLSEFASLGPIFNSSKQIELSESETEYVVTCIKHIYARYVVFQFFVKNTVSEQLLENVTVDMEVDDSTGFRVDSVIPADSITCDETKPVYVKVELPLEASLATASFTNKLKFDVKQVDADSGQAEDESTPEEYPLEDIDISIADFVKRNFVPNWGEKWEELGEDTTAVETFSLSSVNSCADAVKEIIDFLGMQPCDRTETIPPKRTKHILLLSGLAVGGIPILARVRMKVNPSGGVSMELTVRSNDAELSSQIASAMYS